MRLLWIGVLVAAACDAEVATDATDAPPTVDCSAFMEAGTLPTLLDEDRLRAEDPTTKLVFRVRLSSMPGHSLDKLSCAQAYMSPKGGLVNEDDAIDVEGWQWKAIGTPDLVEGLCRTGMVEQCWLGTLQNACLTLDEAQCVATPPCWQMRADTLSLDESCMTRDNFALCNGGLGMAMCWEVGLRGPNGHCWYFTNEPVQPVYNYDPKCPTVDVMRSLPECE